MQPTVGGLVFTDGATAGIVVGYGRDDEGNEDGSIYVARFATLDRVPKGDWAGAPGPAPERSATETADVEPAVTPEVGTFEPTVDKSTANDTSTPPADTTSATVIDTGEPVGTIPPAPVAPATVIDTGTTTDPAPSGMSGRAPAAPASDSTPPEA